MKSTRGINLALLHFIVFIWGFTGILGKEITIDAYSIVWWRVLIATTAIALFALVAGKNLRATPREIASFGGVGFLTALHWTCFFGSIKESNVSVALVVISTTAFFVSIVGPIIRKEKFQPFEILLGIAVIGGLLLIFKFEGNYVVGILLSLAAAAFAAIFSTINSTLIANHTAVKIAFWEMVSAFFFMTLFHLVRGTLNVELLDPGQENLWLLVLLGVACTGFAFVAGIEVMKVLSPFTCALTINLEPIYTIGFALWIYGESEWMSPQFYLGAIIIMSTLFAEILIKKKLDRKGLLRENN